ncbi:MULTISPECIES: type I secretion system permease/ATPase [Rhizobium/Agrobacterium group]|jgi:PrtD family type I secretion system ABC transporter|uniref:type I secretion system permease/ATPase n=1 Tax=Rhizobium/Agrobacterium group TaxID=227290 RepID=UPI0006B95A44|nr:MULTISPECIES: type I secretion system permease/ATPase [Rhizobium/Agrobacterium group]KPF58578.1 type I secretion protein [Rhizobium sp. AAP116]MDM7982133.1 type I secretion system permease/ATPase [Rhizobium sp.]MDM8015670.1 type I secretion system permease/ATPase [Rhizobium sp.]QGG92178.1 type I secretion system permease/ATPase [Agrobacterium sp. MA01]
MNKQSSYKLSGIGLVTGFVFGLSGIINILALTGAFYMLQIYDRALTSGSVPTLIWLSVIAVGLYLFQGMFDILRSQMLVRFGSNVDRQIAPLVHRVVIDMPRFGYSSAEASERGRDVDTVRSFLSGAGPVALFDLPWIPVYLVFVWMLHPVLGMMTLGGALFLACLTIAAELLSRRHAKEMTRAAIQRNNVSDNHVRNGDILHSMGMTDRAIDRFESANRRHLDTQTATSDIAGTFAGISKVLRMMLQSATLGLGAYLTIQGEMSAGAIIASSIVTGRALAPVDQAIAQWKGVISARRSWSRIKDTLAVLDRPPTQFDLPAPSEDLVVEGMTTVAPTTGTVLLSDVSFRLSAGQALALIGPSGGGKTTLARSLLGIWPLLRGSVRVDGADLKQWPTSFFTENVGYLPQEVALLDGTVADNIARFDPDADSKMIFRAARAAGIHDLIVRLPNGYQTQIGPSGQSLSAGQRQRVALARALYGDPFLVVLDEPNSNLDAEGEEALMKAIVKVRERGGIVVIVAHRPSVLQAVDMVGVVQGGKLVSFGPKEEIIKVPANTQEKPLRPTRLMPIAAE